MSKIIERCAGIDVGKRFLLCSVLTSAAHEDPTSLTRRFDTDVPDLEEMCEWLKQEAVTHVVMESTGSYWIPVFNLLEGHFTIVLANPEEVKRLIEDLAIGLALLPSRGSVLEAANQSSKECPVCGQSYDMADEFCGRDNSKLAANSFPRCFLGRFRLEFKIGQGGMGLVYEAIDLQLRRKVAVKLILEDSIKDSETLDRFQREAHLLANFQHSNVVTLFDAGVTPDGRPFLVMERLLGRTLREELNARTRLPCGEVRSIVRQLCAALSAAHRTSLIHRDLKPENIFLCGDQSYQLVKILDFGLAKLLMETSSPARDTQFSTIAGQIVGTPAYMAPELLSGAKPERGSDLWALGIITFEMLTGERPSFGRSGALTNSFVGGLPESWRDFFNWALACEPSQRPGSSDVFLERLEQSAADVLSAGWS